ncbi:MAG: DMT family transporter [Brevundimonas sp.]|jgi:transporter family-2 protein|uniref:DMT family transporter n=1 Tax=Brevundimonas sp. TaxID=1871086 RepID=UPI0022C6AEA8|nr:DMT family transporter [Brevundimonas sp.]MCZ8193961.1 DMT family transporter [Brevundimonas sp.]
MTLSNATAFAVAAVIVGGAFTALQGPTNARLAGAVASPVNAALISFAVGTLVLAALAAVLRTPPDMAATRALPFWAWLGGAYGAVFVVAAAFAVPRLGVASTITLMIAGQLALSLVLDHFGWLGVPRQPLSLTRIAGVALVLAGVLLVRRP